MNEEKRDPIIQEPKTDSSKDQETLENAYVETESNTEVGQEIEVNPETIVQEQVSTSDMTQGPVDDFESKTADEGERTSSIFVGEDDPRVVPISQQGTTENVRVKSGPKVKNVIAVLLAIVLVGSSTFTVGYYQGQIHLQDEKINDRVNAILDKNINDKVYNSVVKYLDEQGNPVTVGDVNIASIYKNVSNSVVGLTSKLKYTDWFNNERFTEGTGSGVIVKEESDRYYIVTNFHVVDGATEVVAEIVSDQIVPATLIGYDEDTDLAVVSIMKKDIPEAYKNVIKPIAIGSSGSLNVGEPAIAIGNPLGYSNTLTYGVVSALDRKVTSDQSNEYIQTDAAINPGNSGGALVNKKGELIGINTSKIAETSVEGIGFAIPTDTIMPIVAELIENGYISKPYIGIGGINIDEDTSKLYEIPIGVLVRYIYEDSPALKAGLKEKDVIIGIDDHKVFTMDDLTSTLKEYNPGDTVTIKVIRDGKDKLEIPLVLGDRNKK
ncbi:S1C family serine protease [Fusibacter ferrireducens]|uniref:Trypsin-like peptidase domain-containing protein n=1 Tax=Fusibacter ferrireducens TaxID=2785058 RepID=A0ABR9ZWJ1_9FIRM|nr:trypsin-like peptidase domain-containing protein [Fusibacter ferrireducens]MBF4694825.1 trypsin-like peptidase domain-containing protein [Fusibacter ferrireducens]